MLWEVPLMSVAVQLWFWAPTARLNVRPVPTSNVLRIMGDWVRLGLCTLPTLTERRQGRNQR